MWDSFNRVAGSFFQETNGEPLSMDLAAYPFTFCGKETLEQGNKSMTGICTTHSPPSSVSADVTRPLECLLAYGVSNSNHQRPV